MWCFMVVGDAALKKRVKNRGVTEHRTCYFLHYFLCFYCFCLRMCFFPVPCFSLLLLLSLFRHFVMTIFPIILSHFYVDTFCIVYVRNLNFKAPFVKFVASRIAHHFVLRKLFHTFQTNCPYRHEMPYRCEFFVIIVLL